MTNRSLAFLRRTGVVALVPVAILGFAACSEKSQGQQASDLLRKGLVAHQSGRIDEAATAYQQVLKHDSKNKFGYYNLGLIAQTSGDNTAAENNYRMALGIDPNFAAALFNLAIVRTAVGDTTGAEALYRKHIQVEPKNAGTYLNLGLLLRKVGRQADGDAELTKAIVIDPSVARRIDPPVGSTAPTSTDTTSPPAKTRR